MGRVSTPGPAPAVAKAPYDLSESELRVLYLLSEGMTDKQIADTLVVTVHTVNKQVGAILLKMNVRSRTAAAVHAIREHIVPLETQ
ncbi:MAG TPA: LuxR C-terminal-related transcriptional regulator [Dehalococcoidia bacterium]|nr:LuxR C-terminal-related transcriptional regulator [Dehalococcoidia bacterium]